MSLSGCFFAPKIKGGYKVKKKVYILRNNSKYQISANSFDKSFHDLQMYITRRKLQITLDNREKLLKELSQRYQKKPKKMNDWLLGLLLLVCHYLLILLLI